MWWHDWLWMAGTQLPENPLGVPLIKRTMENLNGATIIKDDVDMEPLVSTNRHYRYDVSELYKISESNLSKVRHKFLSNDFNNSDGLWDPQKWFHASFGGSRQNSPLELVDCHNHRSTEPDRTHLGPTRKNSHCANKKDKHKGERNGIVLMPQRKNFSTGCQMTKTSSTSGGGGGASTHRQSNLWDRKDDDDCNRGIKGQRRAGSSHAHAEHGSDRDQACHLFEQDHPARLESRGREGERFNRNSEHEVGYCANSGVNGHRDDGRDQERDRRVCAAVERSDRSWRAGNKDSSRSASNRDRLWESKGREQHRKEERRSDHGVRKRLNREAEEPEWFTSGPTSQTDTIELKGFDEANCKTRKTVRSMKDGVGRHPEDTPVVDGVTDAGGHCREKSDVEATDITVDVDLNIGGSMDQPDSKPPPPPTAVSSSSSMFDVNHFFNIEHIPGLVEVCQDSHDGISGTGSRFSKWFTEKTMTGKRDILERDAETAPDSNVNNNLLNHCPSSLSYTDDGLNCLHDVLDGFSSSPRSSPFVGGEEAVTNQYGVDDKVDFSSGLASCVNTLTSVSFHPRDKPGICNHAPSSDSQAGFSVQDAEQQLKAMLFGGTQGASSQPATGARSATLHGSVNRTSKVRTVAELEADLHNGHVKDKLTSSDPLPSTAIVDDQAAFDNFFRMLCVGTNVTPVLLTPAANHAGAPSTAGIPLTDVVRGYHHSGLPSTSVPSPIMFCQQPPSHINAPSPIHPTQLAPKHVVQSVSGSCPADGGCRGDGRDRSVDFRQLPGPQEIAANTQLIIQKALIRQMLEEQKDRFMAKLWQRDQVAACPFSPVQGNVRSLFHSPANISHTSQAKPDTMAFTPTSVLRKMHLERAEKEAKGGGVSHCPERSGYDSDWRAVASREGAALRGRGAHDQNVFDIALSGLCQQMDRNMSLGADPASLTPHHAEITAGEQAMSAGHSRAVPFIPPLMGLPVSQYLAAGRGRPIVKGSGELPPPPTEIGSMLAPQHFTAIPHPLVQVGQASPRPVTRASTRSDNPFDVHRLLDQHRFHQHHLAMQAAGLPLQALSMGPPPPLPFVPVGACPPVNVWLPPPPAPAASLGHRFSSVNAASHMADLHPIHQQHLIGAQMRSFLPLTRSAIRLAQGSSSVSHCAFPAGGSDLPTAVSGIAVPPLSVHPGFGLFGRTMTDSQANGASTSTTALPPQRDGHILKWFSPDVLKSELSSLPPVPTDRSGVMMVEQVERS